VSTALAALTNDPGTTRLRRSPRTSLTAGVVAAAMLAALAAPVVPAAPAAASSPAPVEVTASFDCSRTDGPVTIDAFTEAVVGVTYELVVTLTTPFASRCMFDTREGFSGGDGGGDASSATYTFVGEYTGVPLSLTYSSSSPVPDPVLTTIFRITGGAAETSYAITIGASVNGSASASPTSVASGGQSILTATAASGYVFSSWSCTGGGILSSMTANPAALANIQADATCTPSFVRDGDDNGDAGSGGGGSSASSTPVLTGGSAPSLPAGQGVWQQSGGTSTPLAANPSGVSQLRYTAPGLTVTLSGGPGTSATNGLVASPNGTIDCEVCTTLAPGGVIEAWMFSTPRLVAAHRIEDQPCQTFTIPVDAPLDGGGPVVSGAHTLQLALPTASGMQAVNIGVTVGGPVPASVPAGEGPTVPVGLLAFGLLAAAGAVVAVRRQVVAG